jgi:proteasome lid subunit RPN8/RPN11
MSNWKIKKNVFDTIIYLSKNNYPHEFGAMLVSENSDHVIDELYIIPATNDTVNSVTFRLDLIPLTFRVVGSVHSHPSGSGYPSKADSNFFSRRFINLIMYPPFDYTSFKAYDKQSQPINVDIID